MTQTRTDPGTHVGHTSTTLRERRAKAARRGRLLVIVAPVVALIVLITIWEIVVASTRSLIPSWVAVLTNLIEDPAFWWNNASYTLVNAVIGLIFGVAFAEILAAVIVHSKILSAALMPLAVVIHATPVLAIAPALVVMFGFGALPHIIIVVLITFFPMLINAIAGFNAAPTSLLEVMRAMSASRRDIFIHLRIPASLPYQFAGLKNAVTYCVIGAVVSEFSGSTKGLGATITTSTSYLDLPQLWASILLSAVISLILLGAVSLLEKAIVRW